jgi:hypothetical protein
MTMAGIDFSPEELLEQARGNQTALFNFAARWAREQTGTVDGWASFVGEQFAPSWDGMGDNASALEVARGIAINMATGADVRLVDLTGDENAAVLTIEGYDQDWLDDSGTTVEELDRTNELIFSAIAERRGLSYTQNRDGNTLRMEVKRS